MTTRYVDPAAAGADDGTSWTDAWTTLQSAADTAVAGDVVYCRGTETLSAAIDFDTNSGSAASGFIKFIGCNAGGSVDGTRFVLDGNSAATNCILLAAQKYIWWENLELKNATGAGWDATNANWGCCAFVNCYSHDNSGRGFDAYFCNDGVVFIRCRAIDNGSDGFFDTYYSTTRFALCYSAGNSGAGFAVEGGVAGQLFVGCVCHNNTDKGIDAEGGINAIHCVLDENGADGIIQDTNDYLGLVLGCRITGNGDAAGEYGLDVSAGRVLYGWNFLVNNNSGAANGYVDAIPDDADADTNETSGTEGYTDGANDDFNLTDSATLRSTAIELN